MLVVSSPSGAGKTTLTRNLLAQEKDISLSVSVTTRERRPSEIDGVHYHFISMRAVRGDARRRRPARMGRGARQLLRHAARAGREGAGGRATTCCSTSTGRGRGSFIRRCATDIVSVFVLPPSAAELKSRLERRAEDSAGDHRAAPAQCDRGDRALERIRPCAGQSTISTAASPRCAQILADGRRKSAQRADMDGFVAKLLTELRQIAA